MEGYMDVSVKLTSLTNRVPCTVLRSSLRVPAHLMHFLEMQLLFQKLLETVGKNLLRLLKVDEVKELFS